MVLKCQSADEDKRDFADQVSDEILTFLKEERAANGSLYQWYETRYIVNNIGLSRIDREIAAFVIKRFGATRKIFEVGAAIAQCSQLLGLSGVQALGLEASEANFDMMKRLVARLSSRLDSSLGTRFTPLRGFYPDDASAYIDRETIVLVPSVSCALTPQQQVAVFDALAPSGGVILGVRYFFRARETEEERMEMIREIQNRGFGEPEVVFAWKDWSFGFHPDSIIYLPKT